MFDRTHSLKALAALLPLLVGGLGCHVLDFSPRFEEGEIDIFDDLFAVAVVVMVVVLVLLLVLVLVVVVTAVVVVVMVETAVAIVVVAVNVIIVGI